MVCIDTILSTRDRAGGETVAIETPDGIEVVVRDGNGGARCESIRRETATPLASG